MLFYFGECAHAAAHVKTTKRNGECLILLCQQHSFGPMFTFVRQRGCAMSSFFQSPHLGGQIDQFLSSNELDKLDWA